MDGSQGAASRPAASCRQAAGGGHCFSSLSLIHPLMRVTIFLNVSFIFLELLCYHLCQMYKLDKDQLTHTHAHIKTHTYSNTVKKIEIEERARLLHGWQRNLYVGGDDAGGGPKYRRLHFHMISRFRVWGIFWQFISNSSRSQELERTHTVPCVI